MSEDSGHDGESPTDASASTPNGGASNASEPITNGPLPDTRTFLVYVLAPAIVATAVYWFVADATPLETGLFGAVMVVAILAMDLLFDTIPTE